MVELKKPQDLLQSQSGSLIVIALIGLVILSISFYTGISHLMQTQKQMRAVVIKQQMIAAESRLRNLLMQPTTYKIPEGKKVAVLDEDLLNQFKFKVTGARCESKTPFCGILVTQKLDDSQNPIPYWDEAQTKFTGVISYTGTEVAVKGIEVEVRVPREVVQDKTFMCPPNAPFMAGYLANGDLDCRPLPSPRECMQVGGYIKDVSTNLRAVCSNFGDFISCPSDQYISPPGPSWTGSSWTRSGCTPRLDPYINPSLRPL